MLSLVEIPQGTSTTAAHQLLEPLLRGRTVTLRVNDSKLPRKRRVTSPMLYLQPVDNGKSLLIGMPGYGCEISPIHSIQPLVLMRVGLSAQASKTLCEALTELF